MTIYRNECVDCDAPCMGSSCPNRNVPHSYCDKCGTEDSHLFDVSGKEICKECLDSMFDFRIAENDDDVFVCEDCGEITDTLYDVDGMEVCEKCFKSYFPEIDTTSHSL